MAAKIDGSTKKGYFKLLADASSPTVYYLVPKDSIYFSSSNTAAGAIANAAGNLITTDAYTIDENGNALDTSEKVAQYLSDNRL